MAYAYICRACDHPMSRHRLVKGAESVVDGPYACQHCPCKVAQKAPTYPLSESDYNARFDEYGRRR